MRRTKIIPIRVVPDYTDTDWDGVPDKRDCQPLNPRKQENVETEKTMMREIKRTPPTGYEYARPTPTPTPPPGYQYVQPGDQYGQQFQIPSRMYDRSIINLPAARFKFITYI